MTGSALLEWMHPLWFLALPLALAPLWAWRRPHRLQFSSVGLRGVARGARSWRARLGWLPAALEAAALICLIAALARPQRVERETQRESSGIDILLAVDTSGSMEAPDMGARGQALTRLEAAKRVMAEFIAQRPDDRLGLVLFGQEAFVQAPLTLDHQALADLVAQTQIGMAGKNATAVGSAIAVAAKRMKELDAPSRVLILVTDGRSNAGPVSPTDAAEAAAALGVRVYTIGVGAARGTGLAGLLGGGGADIDEPTMRRIAAITGGKYYRATDTQALAEVYKEINALERSTAKVREYVHRDELFRPWLLRGLGLYLLHLWLGRGPLRRLP